MKYTLILLAFLFHFSAFSQEDTTANKANTDTTGKQATDQAAAKPNASTEPGLEIQNEAIIVGDITYQISLSNHNNKYYTLSLQRDMFSSINADNKTDTNSVISGIRLKANMDFPVFRSIVFEMLNKATSQNLQNKIEIELQVSKIYSAFLNEIKLQNSPEVANLRAQLAAFDGVLDEKFRHAGQLSIKNDTIPTYRHSNRKVIKKNKRILTIRMKEADIKMKNIQGRINDTERKSEEELDKAKDNDKADTRTDIKKNTDLADKLIDSVQMYKDIYDSLRSVRKGLKNNYTKTNGAFRVDSVFIEFFNSAVDKLTIFGKYCVNGRRVCDFKRIKFNSPIRALNRSFGLRGLNINDYFFTVNSGTENEYAIKLSDLLSYSKYKNNLSYIIKDQSVTLLREGSRIIPLERRALFDYLSLITFIDFLGVSNAVNNNYIQIEGRARFPLRLSTAERTETFSNLTFLPMFETYLNASFINGNNIGGRKADIVMNPAKDTMFYSHFDLVRNYNIKAGLSLGLFSVQYKGIHSKIYGAIDLRMYRTAFSFTKVNTGLDSLVQSNVFSLSYSPSVIFEYRPDFNIGADIRLSMDCGLTPLNFRSNDLKYLASKGPIYNGDNKYTPLTNKQKTIYGLEVNAYSFLTPNREKNDGIYFRFAIYTNRNITEISPYIMAGYATSLKGLVKTNKNDVKANKILP